MLLVPSTIFGAILGVVFGSLTGWRRSSGLDAGTTSLFLFLYSMPHYWLAMLFVLIFAFYLGLFPLSGITQGGLVGTEKIPDVIWHMDLPVAVLTLFAPLTTTS